VRRNRALLAYYRDRGLLVLVDGTAPIDVVAARWTGAERVPLGMSVMIILKTPQEIAVIRTRRPGRGACDRVSSQ
jgi:hypothetical protein